MNPPREPGYRVERVVFTSVVTAFCPYLFVYLVGLAFDLPPDPVRWAFRVLHAVMLVGWVVHLRRTRSRISAGDALFWGALAALFLVPGAYLEFPSDPWEHVRRIFSWGATPTLLAHSHPLRCAYFWGWTVLGDVAIDHRRAALSLYGAFWNLVLAAQFYALARRLGLSRAWSRAQVMGTVFFFGTWGWSFYRYYALGPQPLAYAAYLRAVVLGLDLAEGRPVRWLEILAALLVTYLNHPQETLLLVVSAVSLAAYAVARRVTAARFLAALSLAAAAGVAAGPWLVRFASFHLPASVDVHRVLSPWGSFPLWNPASTPEFLGLLGLHGVAGLAAAACLCRRNGPLPFLTLIPTALLLFPPAATAYLVALGLRPELYYRTLFAFPASFALIEALRAGLVALRRRWPRLPCPSLAVLLLLPVALDPAPPVRGRLWFALFSPGPALSLVPLDQTAEWFRVHRLGQTAWREGRVWVGDPTMVDERWREYTAQAGARGAPCFLVTDGASGFVLSAHLGVPWLVQRRLASDFSTLASREALAAYLARNPVCGFLVSEADAATAAEESVVGRVVGHWSPDVVRRSLHPPASYKTLLATLTEDGWTRTPVPPFHSLYEPPASPAR